MTSYPTDKDSTKATETKSSAWPAQESSAQAASSPPTPKSKYGTENHYKPSTPCADIEGECIWSCSWTIYWWVADRMSKVQFLSTQFKRAKCCTIHTAAVLRWIWHASSISHRNRWNNLSSAICRGSTTSSSAEEMAMYRYKPPNCDSLRRIPATDCPAPVSTPSTPTTPD